MTRIKHVINNYAPKCALPGCSTRVSYHKKSTKTNGTPAAKWKSFCAFHRDNPIGKKAKEQYLRSRGCENRDGRLGWICTCTDDDRLTIDHIDGNHLNNDPSNIQVLCHNSHNRKTNINGDHLTRYDYSNKNFDKFFK